VNRAIISDENGCVYAQAGVHTDGERFIAIPASEAERTPKLFTDFADVKR
jgi:hypothetical protein